MPTGQPSRSRTGRRGVRLHRGGRGEALSGRGVAQLEGPCPAFPVPGGQQAGAAGGAQAILQAQEGLAQVVHACEAAAERRAPWQVRKKVLRLVWAELAFMMLGDE